MSSKMTGSPYLGNRSPVADKKKPGQARVFILLHLLIVVQLFEFYIGYIITSSPGTRF